MTYRKKLIEVALPLEAINKASAREKSIRHGHPSTLHLWWARRPLAACRAVIFASLVDDPDDPDAPPEFVQACRELPRGKNAAENDTPRQRLFDFIETLVQWESTTDEKVLETARELIRLATDGNPPPLLDPFAGGGSIPLEAQRLGLEAHASDLNPVAVMICKALIEIPPRFSNMPPVNPRDQKGTAQGGSWKGAAGLAADVRYYGEWMRDRAWERIGHLYPEYNGETVIAWLWARTVKSPNPAVDGHVPLVRSFWLCKRKGKEAWLNPVIDTEHRSYYFEVLTGLPPNKGLVAKGTKAGRATFRCLLSGAPITGDYIDGEANSGRMKVAPMAIVSEGQAGRTYSAFNELHISVALRDAPDYLETFISPNQVPTEPARGTFGSNNAQGRIYGFNRFGDYFTPRQLVALVTFAELGVEVRKEIEHDAREADVSDSQIALRDGGTGVQSYAEAVSLYLAFALSKGVNLWSSLASWMNDRGALRETFARQALPMVWDFAEANPFSSSGGSLLMYVDKVAKAIEFTPAHTQGSVEQEDAAKLTDYRNVLVSTDPPYYDNIEYSDLSDFFYVWMRRSMGSVYPCEFSTLLTPKDTELVANSYRFDGDLETAKRHFELGLEQAFSNMRQYVDIRYPLTTFYAFRQAEPDLASDEISSTGWEVMLEGLVRAGFSIKGTWPVRTEGPGRIVGIGRNALASSIVLVCRPRPANAPMTPRREFVNALRRELPAALREMQSGNIAPVDLAQASIGPGMAVYSRYSKVLEPNGERLTVRTALQTINQVLDEYLAEQEGYIDEDTRFAVAWFEQYGFSSSEFGVADVLARAKNTSVDGLAYAGILESGAGKVRLYRWDELDPGWDPTTDQRLTAWEATHHLIERLNIHGEEGAARLLAKMPSDLAAQARQLAYRLYSICERKGWAEHARDYNTLAISWSASQEQAREFKEQYRQGRLFE